MKVLAILLICTTVCWAYEDQCQGKQLRMVVEKCVGEKGADQVDVEDLINHKPARNDIAKCFRGCLFDKCEYFSPTGKLNDNVPARLANLLHGSDKSKIPDIEKAAKKCMATPITDNICNSVESYIACLTAECANCNMKFTNVFD